MKRTTAAALAAVTALALPAVPAGACSMPTGFFQTDRDPLVAGGTVLLTGDVMADANGRIARCVTPIAPPGTAQPSESPSGDPTIAPSSPAPLVTLPPLVPVAYHAGAATRVTVSIAEHRGYFVAPGPAREIGTIAANPRKPYHGEYLYSFSGRVTLPADVRPGTYELSAYQEGVVGYGHIRVDVVRGLAATGGATDGMLRLAALALVTGMGALVAARRLAR